MIVQVKILLTQTAGTTAAEVYVKITNRKAFLVKTEGEYICLVCFPIRKLVDIPLNLPEETGMEKVSLILRSECQGRRRNDYPPTAVNKHRLGSHDMLISLCYWQC